MELKTKIKMIITAKTVCEDDRVIGSHFAADDIMIVVDTHTKQLCVGFSEWQKQEERNGNIEWLQGENTWAVFESAPYFHFSNIWITHSDLYEHYLKYLKEKENAQIQR